MNNVNKQLEIIKIGAEEILPEAELIKKLSEAEKSKKPLTIKFGVDPTAPDLHLGHAVPLNKLRRFQDLGHKVTLIIGDFTARIGDPSGRKATRPQLNEKEIKANAKTYTQQAFKILDKDKTEVVFNADWLEKINFVELLQLCGKFTVARLLERDDFSKRFKENESIGLHEFMYPLMQAYDSVRIKADVEIGGTDQKFNMLAGRELQEKLEQKPQVVITMPILEGIDGVQKMSKSLNNHIGLTEPPEQIFGKVMSIPDKLMIRYFNLATQLSKEEIADIEKGLKLGKLHPGETKRLLAKEIVTIYYSKLQAEKAEAEFNRVFKEKEMPSESPEFELPEVLLGENGKVWIPKALTESGIVSSSSEGRRMIQQGAVKYNNELVTDPNFEFIPKDGDVLRVGKRKIVKLRIK